MTNTKRKMHRAILLSLMAGLLSVPQLSAQSGRDIYLNSIFDIDVSNLEQYNIERPGGKEDTEIVLNNISIAPGHWERISSSSYRQFYSLNNIVGFAQIDVLADFGNGFVPIFSTQIGEGEEGLLQPIPIDTPEGVHQMTLNIQAYNLGLPNIATCIVTIDGMRSSTF